MDFKGVIDSGSASSVENEWIIINLLIDTLTYTFRPVGNKTLQQLLPEHLR